MRNPGDAYNLIIPLSNKSCERMKIVIAIIDTNNGMRNFPRKDLIPLSSKHLNQQ